LRRWGGGKGEGGSTSLAYSKLRGGKKKRKAIPLLHWKQKRTGGDFAEGRPVSFSRGKDFFVKEVGADSNDDLIPKKKANSQRLYSHQ